MSEFIRPTCAHCSAWTKRKSNGTYERYCSRHVDGTPCATKGCDTLCHRKYCKVHSEASRARFKSMVAASKAQNGPVTVRKATPKATTTTRKATPKAINNRDAGLVALQAAMEAMAQAIALLAQ